MECELDGITIHYEVYGEGKPIIMLHGWPLDHRVMVSTIEPLFKQRQGWQRFYPDLPGMGLTPGADWITTQDQVLDIVLDFINKVAPGQRYALVGYSYGGYLARGAVYRQGADITGLCLIAPVIRSSDEPRTLPDHVTLVENPALLADLDPELAQAFAGFAVVQCRELLESMQAVGSPARIIADHAFLARLHEHYQFSFDVDTLTEPFAGPTLMIMGRQDALCGYADAWDIVENYSRGTVVVLDRAGHGLMVEQQGLFNALVCEWLDRVEEFVALAG